MPIPTLARGLLLAVLALAAAGCANTTGRAQAQGAAAANATTSADSLAQTHWELTRWTAPDGSLRAIPHGDNGEPIQLTFLAQGNQYRVNGFSGCNRYMGGYKLQGGKLSISAPASTRMACPAPERGQLERDYLKALASIQTFTLDSGGAPRHLTFNVRDGDVLEFTRRQDPPTPQ
ncbi:META domain-containing protein [Bordetella petrii]|uniref:META domain-containing protein n=1 Tax=Bordetella petrii TaxID=94624 RepID=UPI001A974DCF|nr:META domain-containing protein [Bordetella petrii]MBO1113994.1 META domain-containing protein [Bordetella petrii]